MKRFFVPALLLALAACCWSAPARAVEVLAGEVGLAKRPGERYSDEEEFIYGLFFDNKDNYYKLCDAIEDFFRKTLAGKVKVVRGYSEAGREETGLDMLKKVVVPILQVDKVVAFTEHLTLNGKAAQKRTVYVALNFYLVQASTAAMVYARPMVLPVALAPGTTLADFGGEIVDALAGMFNDRNFPVEARNALLACLAQPGLVFGGTDTYSVTETTLSKAAAKAFKDPEQARGLALLFANASLARRYVVIPSSRRHGDMRRGLNRLKVYGLQVFFLRDESASLDETDNSVEFVMKEPDPTYALAIKIKCASKVLEQAATFDRTGYVAGAYFDYRGKRYKCADAVTSMNSKNRRASSDAQYYNAMINALSKLGGGIHACKQIEK